MVLFLLVDTDSRACFEGTDYGNFDYINEITMFADYRVPQVSVDITDTNN
jgi:hypothetical protein